MINDDCLYFLYSLVPNTVSFMTVLYMCTDLSSLILTVSSHERGSLLQTDVRLVEIMILVDFPHRLFSTTIYGHGGEKR